MSTRYFFPFSYLSSHSLIHSLFSPLIFSIYLCQVVDLLRKVLITFEPSVIQKKCTAFALSSFIHHCHSHIKKVDDWALVFDYLLCVGIGCHPSDLPVRKAPAVTIPQASSAVSPAVPPVPAVEIQIEEATCEAEGMIGSEEERKKLIGPKCTQLPSASVNNIEDEQRAQLGKVIASSEPSQPFIPGNSSVRDVEAYLKCKDILTVVIKEILPKSSAIQENPVTDAEINQMAIDSLILLRFYSLHDESLRQQTGSTD